MSDKKTLLVTTTGEPYQPVRLKWTVPAKAYCLQRLKALECVGLDAETKLLTLWNTAEAQGLKLGTSHGLSGAPPSPLDGRLVILGTFRFPDASSMVLEVRSIARASEIARMVRPVLGAKAKLTRARVVNRWFAASELADGLSELDKWLDRNVTVIRWPSTTAFATGSARGSRRQSPADCSASPSTRRRPPGSPPRRSRRTARTGIDCTRYRSAIAGAASTSSLSTFALPPKSTASWSMTGESARHGAHQEALKSTSTGLSLLRTSCSNCSCPMVAATVVSWLGFALPHQSRQQRRRYAPFTLRCDGRSSEGRGDSDLHGASLPGPRGGHHARMGERGQSRLEGHRHAGGQRGHRLPARRGLPHGSPLPPPPRQGVLAPHLHCPIGAAAHVAAFHGLPWVLATLLALLARQRTSSRTFAP